MAAILGEAATNYEEVRRLLGSELVGLDYEPLYSYMSVEGPYATVIAGDFVSTAEGSGIVHIAPAFGADDLAAAAGERPADLCIRLMRPGTSRTAWDRFAGKMVQGR